MSEQVYTPTFGFDPDRKVWQINGADIDADNIIQLAAMIQAERQERVIGRGFSKFSRIASAVAAATDVSVEEMIGPHRIMLPTIARHIAIYLCRAMTGESLSAIGKFFGRDHSTVIYAIRRIDDLLEVKDRDLMAYYNDALDILNRTNGSDD